MSTRRWGWLCVGLMGCSGAAVDKGVFDTDVVDSDRDPDSDDTDKVDDDAGAPIAEVMEIRVNGIVTDEAALAVVDATEIVVVEVDVVDDAPLDAIRSLSLTLEGIPTPSCVASEADPSGVWSATCAFLPTSVLDVAFGEVHTITAWPVVETGGSNSPGIEASRALIFGAAPDVAIVAPGEGATVTPSFTLSAAAADLDSPVDLLSVVWRIDHAGGSSACPPGQASVELVGTLLLASCELLEGDLLPGAIEASVTITDETGLAASDRVGVTLVEP